MQTAQRLRPARHSDCPAGQLPSKYRQLLRRSPFRPSGCYCLGGKQGTVERQQAARTFEARGAASSEDYYAMNSIEDTDSLLVLARYDMPGLLRSGEG